MVEEIPALKNQCINRLRLCLQGYSADRAISDIEIPLKLSQGRFPVLYQSAIAHRLTTGFNQSAITIATQLVGQIQSKSTEFFLFPDPLENGLGHPDFTLQVMPSGMILLELTDIGLANWLQQMIQIVPIDTQTSPSPDFPDSLFAVQYSHARCCSLLGRAHQEGLITLTPLEGNTTSILWRLSHPHDFPWLTPTQQLQFSHPAELALIIQLITIADCYCQTSSNPNWKQLADNLSQTFQQFYSQCQIWGNVKQQTPQLAIARLGLVWITQWLLRLILQEQLNVIAPLEL